MHPANFPARKNERRQRALVRLITTGTTGKLVQREYDRAYVKLVALLDPAARGQRSKKLRGQRRQAA